MKRMLAVLMLCALLTGCAGENSARQTVFAMDTVMDLQIWGGDADLGIARARALLRDLESLWSATDEESVLSCLNRGQYLQLDAAQQSLLDRVEALSERTGGAFDPKLRRVSEVWGFYDEQYRIPAQEEIDAALADPQWDLGAALKGYAGQRIVGILEELEIDRAVLNLGGNIQTYGTKADGSPWQVGIQDPEGDGNVAVIQVEGTAAVVTSGDYQRYFEVDGVRYHHILDPETGCPADSGLRSVTVVCRDGLTADALSTALFVMGLEEGAAFWRESDDFEAVFLLASGEIYATEGIRLTDCEFEVICREK